MKTLIIATTLAASVLSFAPAQASVKAGLYAADAQTLIERRGRGCDTAQDQAEKPRCAK